MLRSHRTVMKMRNWLAPLVLTMAPLLAGCGGKAPEQTMIGYWEMDKEATKNTNPFMAAAPDLVWHEFKADGSYAEGLLGSTKKGTWKQTKKEGGSVTLELSIEGDKEPTVVEIAVVGKDHITINYPKGLGVIHLKRGDGSARVQGKDGGGGTSEARVTIDTGIKDPHCVSVSADGKFAAACGSGKEKNVRVWNIEKKEQVCALDHDSQGTFVRVALPPDGKSVAHSGYSCWVHINDVNSGKELRSFPGQGLVPYGLQYAPAGDLLVQAGNTRIHVWDPSTGKERSVWDADHEVKALSGFFDAGRKIASGGDNGTIKVWEIAGGKLIRSLTGGNKEHHVRALAVSPDGKRLVSAAFIEPIKVWDLSDGKVLRTIETAGKSPESLLVLADGKTIVYPDQTNIVLEDMATQAKRVLRAGPGWVEQLAVTPDGKVLVSADDKGTLKVWDLK
jgi:DNA-binding beta-propeller fold protein YncE